MLSNSSLNFSAHAFSHFNPVNQMIKEKKIYSKEVQEILREDGCKQITFEQYFRISKFEGEVPQFLDDLFHHLTTLSLKDILKKQNAIPNPAEFKNLSPSARRKSTFSDLK